MDELNDAAAWTAKVASVYNGATLPPGDSNNPLEAIPGDPPHERAPIATQLGELVNRVYPMNGFVTNCATVIPVPPGDKPPVLNYFANEETRQRGFRSTASPSATSGYPRSSPPLDWAEKTHHEEIAGRLKLVGATK